MGHLLLDGVFDEEKYDRGMIKLLRKPSQEEELEVWQKISLRKSLFNISPSKCLKEEISTEKDPRDGFAEFNYMQVTRNLWRD